MPEAKGHDTQANLWRVHAAVLGGAAVIASLVSVLVWLHPSAGFIRGGILGGADVRATVIEMLWLMLTAGALAATCAVVVLRRFVARRRAVLLAAYSVALLLEPAVLRVLDHYF